MCLQRANKPRCSHLQVNILCHRYTDLRAVALREADQNCHKSITEVKPKKEKYLIK